MRLSKKSAHRIIVSLGLVAPIVYLFGSLFFGLNGAHDAFPFSADYDVVTSSKLVDFNQKLSIGDFDSSTGWGATNCTFTVSSNVATVVGSSAGSFGISANYNLLDTHQKLVRVSMSSALGNTLYISGVSRNFTLAANGSWQLCSYIETSPLTWAFPRFGLYNAQEGAVVYIKDVMIFDLTQMFGAGNEPTVDEFNSFYSASYYPYVESRSEVYEVSSTPDNSQYLFNQFFAKDNFLELWGENVLSDNPVGFSPFATFIKFFDSSLIHGAGSQIALMMYGQLYYMLHIMLFDLVYHVLVFIPNLITGVFNKFGGGLNDE